MPIETDMLTYLQSAAVGAGSVLTYGIGGAIVNRLLSRLELEKHLWFCGTRSSAAFDRLLSARLVMLHK